MAVVVRKKKNAGILGIFKGNRGKIKYYATKQVEQNVDGVKTHYTPSNVRFLP